MTSFGYTLSSEEHGPADLVANARRAEELGFDFVSISDHYHPWVDRPGPQPVRVVGAGRDRGVHRAHRGRRRRDLPDHADPPGVVAQAAATTSLLFDGRFFFGVGTGEALNEHILGDRWPRPEIRREMLDEAVDVIRQLWTGDTVDHRGEYYEVENARLFDPPTRPVPIIVSGFGPRPPSSPAGSATATGATRPTAS